MVMNKQKLVLISLVLIIAVAGIIFSISNLLNNSLSVKENNTNNTIDSTNIKFTDNIPNFYNCTSVPCDCWKNGCALYCMECESK